MGIPAREIGTASSTTNQLLRQISKQLDRLIKVVAANGTTGITTTTI